MKRFVILLFSHVKHDKQSYNEHIKLISRLRTFVIIQLSS